MPADVSSRVPAATRGAAWLHGARASRRLDARPAGWTPRTLSQGACPRRSVRPAGCMVLTAMSRPALLLEMNLSQETCNYHRRPGDNNLSLGTPGDRPRLVRLVDQRAAACDEVVGQAAHRVDQALDPL